MEAAFAPIDPMFDPRLAGPCNGQAFDPVLEGQHGIYADELGDPSGRFDVDASFARSNGSSG